MTKCIVYKQKNGVLATCTPTEQALQNHTIEEIAEKDVPEGLPFKIVSLDDLPSDNTFRDAWDIDESELTDGVGGKHNMFITDPRHPESKNPLPDDPI